MQQKDYLTRSGAAVLRAQIISYWALRTGNIERSPVHVFPLFERDSTTAATGAHENAYASRACVRSNMINGTPRGFIWRFDADAPRGKRWRLVRNEQEASCADQSLAANDAGGARRTHRKSKEGKRSKPALAGVSQQTAPRALAGAVSK